jgi:hypothetical protein
MTDDELAAKTILFNKTLMQYGRAKALHTHLGSTAYESELLNELDDLLDQIKTEINSRRTNEAQESNAAQ